MREIEKIRRIGIAFEAITINVSFQLMEMKVTK